MLTLDVVIPTYNRADRLELALRSLAEATVPRDLRVRIVVVDNNSPDSTAQTVQRVAATHPLEIELLSEREQGRSFALNFGIRSSGADLVGMIDDDEKVDENWFVVIHRWFSSNQDISFLGGPCVGDWEAPRPRWVPDFASGVLGEVLLADQVTRYGPELNGILMGGNAVVRRQALLDAGLYDTRLGRKAGTLISGEDQAMHEKLIATGHIGYYDPALIIHHWIPMERLTRRYFRRWTRANAYSLGLSGRSKSMRTARILGIPRYMWTDTVRTWVRTVPHLLTFRWGAPEVFGAELLIHQLIGYLRGHHAAG